MDYFKVKTNHVFYSKHLSDKEFRAWINCMAVTAHLEDIPTKEELMTKVHPTTLSKYIEKQNNTRTTYSEVIDKVIEDVQSVKNKRSLGKIRTRKNRSTKHADLGTNKEECNALHGKAGNANVRKHIKEDKIKEDKIKEEREKEHVQSHSQNNLQEKRRDPLSIDTKIDNQLERSILSAQSKKVFDSIYTKWESKRRGNRFEAIESFNSNFDISNDSEFEDIKSAFDEYCRSDDVRDSVIMKPAKWFTEWHNWIPVKGRK